MDGALKSEGVREKITTRSKRWKREEARRKANAISVFMNVTKRRTAGEAYKPRPEDIPAPFTDEELKYIEAVERGCRKPKRNSKPEPETEEEKQLKAYKLLECKSYFFS